MLTDHCKAFITGRELTPEQMQGVRETLAALIIHCARAKEGKAALTQLADKWGATARAKFRSAEQEKDAMGRRLIEHGAICYFNCREELLSLLQSGDAPANLELQVFEKDVE